MLRSLLRHTAAGGIRTSFGADWVELIPAPRILFLGVLSNEAHNYICPQLGDSEESNLEADKMSRDLQAVSGTACQPAHSSIGLSRSVKHTLFASAKYSPSIPIMTVLRSTPGETTPLPSDSAMPTWVRRSQAPDALRCHRWLREAANDRRI